MVMKDCLEKNVQKKVLIEKHREYYLVLDEETGAIFLVNETSHFLYENFDYPEKPLKYKHIRRISD